MTRFTSSKTLLYIHPTFKQAHDYMQRSLHREAEVCLKELCLNHREFWIDIWIYLLNHLKKKPLDEAVFTPLVNIYLICNNYTDAFDTTCELLTINAYSTDAFVWLGKIYQANHFQKDIKELFEQAFNNALMIGPVYEWLPYIYSQEKEYQKLTAFYHTMSLQFPHAAIYKEKELNAYEEWLHSNPDQTDIRCDLIHRYTHQCKPIQVISHIQHLVNQEIWCKQTGIDKLIHLDKIFPHTKEILLEIAYHLISLDRYSEAVSYLKDCLKINGCHEEIQCLLEKILQKYPAQIWAIQILIELKFIQKEYANCLHLISQLIEHEFVQNLEIPSMLTQLTTLEGEYGLYATWLKAHYHLKTHRYQKAIHTSRLLFNGLYDFKARLIYAESLHLQGFLFEARQTLLEMGSRYCHTPQWQTTALPLLDQWSKVYPHPKTHV